MALNISCSKTIVDMLGTHLPRSAPHVSNTPKILLSQNDKNGCNLGFPRLVQNKDIFPLQAIPSKAAVVDFDNLVLQAQEQPNEQPKEESKTINVKFQLKRNCNFGEEFLVVGNDPMFGSWNPENAIPMTWSEGHVWTTEMDLPVGKYQFKMILKRKEGEISWQPGPDRTLHTWEAMNRITVCEDWDNADQQKVTEDDDEVSTTMEEDQPANTNVEFQTESETPNLAENLVNPQRS